MYIKDRGVAIISVYIPPKISNRFVPVWDINTFWNCNDSLKSIRPPKSPPNQIPGYTTRCPLHNLLPDIFASLDVSIPRWFATSLDVVTCLKVCNFSSGGETLRKVAKCPVSKSPKVRNIKVSTRPGSETSCYRFTDRGYLNGQQIMTFNRHCRLRL